MTTTQGSPDADDLAAYLNLPGTPDPVALTTALDVARETQAAVCDTTVVTASLRAAQLRRAARHLAARSASLGLLDLGDLGTTRIPQWDAETDRYESAYRRAPLA